MDLVYLRDLTDADMKQLARLAIEASVGPISNDEARLYVRVDRAAQPVVSIGEWRGQPVNFLIMQGAFCHWLAHGEFGAHPYRRPWIKTYQNALSLVNAASLQDKIIETITHQQFEERIHAWLGSC